MNKNLPTENSIQDIDAFESRYRYDATYMREMLDVAPEAYFAFCEFLPLAQFRLHAPPDVYYTAKITAFRQVDCGPCLQLAIRRAREDGVDESLLRSILSPNTRLSSPLDKVRSFAEAILSGSAESDSLRAELIDVLGPSVIVELALAVASAQVFPVVKRAMGHYQSCATTPLEI